MIVTTFVAEPEPKKEEPKKEPEEDLVDPD